MSRKVPYARHELEECDIEAVLSVLRSDWLTQGPLVDIFESRISEYCGVSGGVAFNSATSALHSACLALDVGPKDVVWTVPNTFVASANCSLYCGAKIDFVDIDPLRWTMCPEALQEKLENASISGHLPKVLIPVHFGGAPAEMEKIFKICSQYGVKVIEDASHALGASYRKSKIGACVWSHVTIFSFHPVKMITTGEGGMAVSNDKMILDRLHLIRSHGITRDRSQFHCPDTGPWSYQQVMLGYNYRMTDIAAGLGCSQLNRLEDFVTKRSQIANQYRLKLGKIMELNFQSLAPRTKSSWHLFVVRINDDCFESSKEVRRSLYNHMTNNGIGVNVHYEPVHLQPYFRKLGFKKNDYPNAERYADGCLSIPLFIGLEQSDISRVCDLMFEFFKV
jgi:UDP-4-amino-4,6-dideoxy-N-acetyl-beta-L-altrosamine transaminase